MNRAKSLLLAVGIIPILAIAGSARAVENSGVGGKPANPRADNPRTESIFVYELSPGQSTRDAVLVVNNNDVAKQVEVYATDSLVSSGGAFGCEQKADTVDYEGSWITLDKRVVNLPPYGTETIGFDVRVPENASVGEHNACIAIQANDPPAASGVNGVQLSFRSAIRVAITVPGELNKQLTFESLTAQTKEKVLVVNEVLFNGGNVSLDTNITTNVKTFFGSTYGTVEGEYPVLAGQRAEFNFEFKRPSWGGWYRVEATADYNSDESSSLGVPGQSTQRVSSSTVVFIMPAPAALAGYVLFIVCVLGPITYVFLYRRKMRRLRAEAISHTVSAGDDITSISSKYDADWKVTARINKLKPPYTLQHGMKLLVVPGASYAPKASTKTKRTSTKASEVKKTGHQEVNPVVEKGKKGQGAKQEPSKQSQNRKNVTANKKQASTKRRTTKKKSAKKANTKGA